LTPEAQLSIRDFGVDFGDVEDTHSNAAMPELSTFVAVKPSNLQSIFIGDQLPSSGAMSSISELQFIEDARETPMRAAMKKKRIWFRRSKMSWHKGTGLSPSNYVSTTLPQ
jgi:hypothetical protein